MLIACGDDKHAATENKPLASSKSKVVTKTNEQEKLLACSVLDVNYIKSNYPDATEIKLEESGRTYALCSVDFIHNEKKHHFNLTLGVIGGADESHLEASASYFRKKNRIESITGAGEKAYNRTGKGGQISAIHQGNLIHVSVQIDFKYDLELSKKLTNDMFVVLVN